MNKCLLKFHFTFFHPISFLFSSCSFKTNTQTHTHTRSAVDGFDLFTFFPLDFAHIWCGSYHTDTIAAASAAAESHSFLALLCILILKMIVGQWPGEASLALIIELFLLSSSSLICWPMLLLIITEYIHFDKAILWHRSFVVPPSFSSPFPSAWSIEQRSQIYCNSIETFRYQKHDRRCKFSTSPDANAQNRMFASTFLSLSSCKWAICVFGERVLCVFKRFGRLLEIGLWIGQN